MAKTFTFGVKFAMAMLMNKLNTVVPVIDALLILIIIAIG